MNLPPYGLCMPCLYVRCRDGDTIEIRLRPGGMTWAIRLINCWCKELHQSGGKEAKAFAEEILSQVSHLSVWIPAPQHVNNILQNLTFDRIPGWLFVSTDETLNHMMVVAGHATENKIA